MTDTDPRHAIVSACRRLDAEGLNRAASGNVSLRLSDGFLITPSAVPADALTADSIVALDMAGSVTAGALRPSSEWRFHRDILAARPDVGAVVHAHSPFATILADARLPIPAIHYMIAAFGGPDIRVSDYATFGTAALSKAILTALEGRNGCLIANHGMVVAGPDLARTLWLAGELEALAHQYYHCRLLGGGHVLSESDIAETAERFADYGVTRPSE